MASSANAASQAGGLTGPAGAPGATPAAGGASLIRGRDGKLHTPDEVAFYGGSLNGQVAAKDPADALFAGLGGSRQDPNLPRGMAAPAGMAFQKGGGNQNAFSPQAGTWTPSANAGGGYNRAALAALLARARGGGGGGGNYYGRGGTAGYTTSGR